jgi:hypothetical protein
MHATFLTHQITFDLMILIILVEKYKLWNSTLWNFLQPPVISSHFKPNILLGTFVRSQVQISARKTAIMTKIFLLLLSFFTQTRNSTLYYATTACFQIILYSSFTYHPLIRRYIVWVTEKASLNKLRTNPQHTALKLSVFVSAGLLGSNAVSAYKSTQRYNGWSAMMFLTAGESVRSYNRVALSISLSLSLGKMNSHMRAVMLEF